MATKKGKASNFVRLFFVVGIRTWIRDPGSVIGIRDPGWKKCESGILVF
jgi:hypothetical protein